MSEVINGEIASKLKMFVRPMIAMTLTLVVGYKELLGAGVSGEMLTLYSMIMAFYFGEAAGARQPGAGAQE